MFVVDTTRSMGPYLASSKELIRTMYDEISESADEASVDFGMIGYRDSLEAAPDLDYEAEVFAPLQLDGNSERFVDAVADMDVASTSSVGFEEDAIAGIKLALDETDWEKFNARYIVHVSDAGLRDGSDPYSTTSVSIQDMQTTLNDRGIRLRSLYLATPEGRQQHSRALSQLRSLGRSDNGPSPVFRIEGGTEEDFGEGAQRALDMARMLGSAVPNDQELDCAEDDAICQRFNADGRALRLEWKGRRNGVSAPLLMEGWAADFALNDPGRDAFDVRVLLTKNQLNDLYISLGAIREAASRSIDEDPTRFFTILQDLVARAMREPQSLQSLSTDVGLLSERETDIGALRDVLSEFLSGLPYDSSVSDMTLETWADLTDAQREEMLNNIQSKMTMYESYYGDRENWIAFHEDTPESEKVYPIPLALLP